MYPTFTFTAKLWMYSGKEAWYFVTLPKDKATEIKALTGSLRRNGFGSVKVAVSIGGIQWWTSIFPDSKSNSYLLPIKKEIRNKLNVNAGDVLNVLLVPTDS